MRTIDPFERARKIARIPGSNETRYVHSSVVLDRRFREIGVGKNHWTGRLIPSEDDVEKLIKKTVHSELAALSRVDIRRLQGASIINYARTNVSSNMSRPCDSCFSFLQKLGFRKVYYSLRSPLEDPIWKEEYFDGRD